MFETSRELSFCYGHRLLEHPGRCAHLHGHNGVVVLTLASPTLDRLGMVADFGVVRERLGAWIDANLDHRMILRRDDPALAALQKLGEPVYVVDFDPTAEQLARLLFEQARELGLPASRVRLFETPTCFADYSP